jgi:hypothetical protein
MERRSYEPTKSPMRKRSPKDSKTIERQDASMRQSLN